MEEDGLKNAVPIFFIDTIRVASFPGYMHCVPKLSCLQSTRWHGNTSTILQLLVSVCHERITSVFRGNKSFGLLISLCTSEVCDLMAV